MRNRWDPAAAAGLSGPDLVCYASRLLGAEESLVVWGGGNSSIKQEETDYRGERVRVLRVKGSGSDMKTLAPKDLPGIRMDAIDHAFTRDTMSDEEMVAYLAAAKLDPASPRPSIETLLHGFVPHPHVYHTHADVIAAITDVPDSRPVVEAIYGDRVAWVPYIRPGFQLSRLVGEAVRARPDLDGVILDKHGIITFGETAEQAYARMISLVTLAEEYLAARHDRTAITLGGRVGDPVPADQRPVIAAALAPLLRGAISSRERSVVLFDDHPDALRFSAWTRTPEVSQRGPATPDHLLYTRQRALVVDVIGRAHDEAIAADIRAAVATYEEQYRAYVERHRDGASLHPIDPAPRTIIVPRLGLFHAGKDVRAATVIRDIYHRSVAVMEGASAVQEFQPIDEAHIFAFEYWPLENYKLSLLPPERPFSRQVVAVTGGASGIGRAIALAFAREGACVAILDRDGEGAARVAAEITGPLAAPRPGERSGRTSASLFPQAIGLETDVTSEASVQAALQDVALRWGGVDHIVANAGIAMMGALVDLDLADWERTQQVNAGGVFLAVREGLRLLTRQGTGGSIVVVASKNVTAPGQDFGAYSASKAAALQVARIAALEGAPHGIRVNAVNPDGIFGDSRFWTDEMRAQRARTHGVAPEALDAFYASRNLLKRAISAEDVAHAVLFLASDRAAAITGAFLPVDGGVPAAFPR